MKRASAVVMAVIMIGLLLGGLGCREAAEETSPTVDSPPAGETAPAPETDVEEDAVAESDTSAAEAVDASATDWIGRPLSEFLATVDFPTSYEMRTVEADESEAPGATLFKLDGRRPVFSKIVEGDRWMLFDMEEGAMYGYKGTGNVVTRISLEQFSSDDDPNSSLDTDTKILRDETVDGYDCWVVRAACVGPEREVWVDKKQGLVRQVRNDDGLTRFAYSRINEIPDSEFELPDGMEIRERSLGAGR